MQRYLEGVGGPRAGRSRAWAALRPGPRSERPGSRSRSRTDRGNRSARHGAGPGRSPPPPRGGRHRRGNGRAGRSCRPERRSGPNGRACRSAGWSGSRSARGMDHNRHEDCRRPQPPCRPGTAVETVIAAGRARCLDEVEREVEVQSCPREALKTFGRHGAARRKGVQSRTSSARAASAMMGKKLDPRRDAAARHTVGVAGLDLLDELVEYRPAHQCPERIAHPAHRASFLRQRPGSNLSGCSGPSSNQSSTLVRRRTKPPSRAASTARNGAILDRDADFLHRRDEDEAIVVLRQHGRKQTNQGGPTDRRPAVKPGAVACDTHVDDTAERRVPQVNGRQRPFGRTSPRDARPRSGRRGPAAGSGPETGRVRVTFFRHHRAPRLTDRVQNYVTRARIDKGPRRRIFELAGLFLASAGRTGFNRAGAASVPHSRPSRRRPLGPRRMLR